MKKVLVTGGTVFVSRYLAEYYIAKGYGVYVMNRNHREQSEGVRLVKADRYNIGNALGGMHFDLVIDTALYRAGGTASAGCPGQLYRLCADQFQRSISGIWAAARFVKILYWQGTGSGEIMGRRK